MFAFIPPILQRARSLPSISDQHIFLKKCAEVAQSMLATTKVVQLWHDNFWKTSPTPRYWTVPSRATNPADIDHSDKTFPLCFEFQCVPVSVAVMLCWSVIAQLNSNVIQIYDLVQARLGASIELEDLLAQTDATVVDPASMLEAASEITPPSTAEKGRLIQEIQSEGTKMARYICQSMEYYHRIEMGTIGGQATIYPSWSARQYFRLHPGHEREWSWLQNICKMKGHGTRWGLRTMRFADIVEPLGGFSN